VSGIPSIEEQQELQKEEAERVRTRVEQLGKYLLTSYLWVDSPWGLIHIILTFIVISGSLADKSFFSLDPTLQCDKCTLYRLQNVLNRGLQRDVVYLG
jgi:hypothetical protein